MNINLNRSLSNIDLINYSKLLEIKIRGVFMLDTLPDRIFCNERGIVNLDSIEGEGSHWVAYNKQKQNIYYFDAIGGLQPPLSLVKYFKTQSPHVKIYYNLDRLQKVDSYVCGHLCLLFLANQL